MEEHLDLLSKMREGFGRQKEVLVQVTSWDCGSSIKIRDSSTCVVRYEFLQWIFSFRSLCSSVVAPTLPDFFESFIHTGQLDILARLP